MDALTLGEDEFVDLILSDMPPRPANYEDITATNLGQNAVDDEEAFTLELGPNNCAPPARTRSSPLYEPGTTGQLYEVAGDSRIDQWTGQRS